MSLKSKFIKKSDDVYNKNNKSFTHYLNLEKYNLEKFVFKREEKDYLFDILPYNIETNLHPDYGKSDEDYHLEVWVHSIYIGNTWKHYLCMNKMYGKNCEVCNEFKRKKEKYENEGQTYDEMKDELSPLTYKQRFIYHIKYKDKKYILDMPYKSFEETWKKALGRKKERGIEIFPAYINAEGFTSLEFTYSPKGQNFYDIINYDFPEIKDYNKDYVKDLVSLEKLLVIPDQEEIKNVLNGIENEPEEEQENNYADYVENEPEEETVIQEDKPVKKKKKVDSNICPYMNEEGIPKYAINHDEYHDCDNCVNDYPEIFISCKKESEVKKK